MCHHALLVGLFGPRVQDVSRSKRADTRIAPLSNTDPFPSFDLSPLEFTCATRPRYIAQLIFRNKLRSGNKNSTRSVGDKKHQWDRALRTEGTRQSLDLLPTAAFTFIPGSSPDRNGDRVTGEFSCCNELPNVFLENLQRSRWLELLYKNLL